MKRFTKKKEDFKCENCGQEVKGDGYTNHCPHCLWSKHVDVNPGDRLEECGGLMRPIDVYKQKQEWILTHRCEICGAIKRNKVDENDNFDQVIKLVKEISEKKSKKGG